MTLCLAATCHYQKKAAMVFCCDAAGARDDVISENAFKMRGIGDFHIMLAGDLSAADELLMACGPSIQGYQSGGNDLAMNEMLTSLRKAVGLYRRNLNHEYLTTRYGITFDEFLEKGKTYFTEVDQMQIWAELRRLDLRAWLILSSFSDDEAVHITISSDGRVQWADHFAVAGTGARLCNAFLQQRAYQDYISLDDCLFRVVEAKMAAEHDPYVGQDTKIMVFTPPRNKYLLRGDYVQKLRDLIQGRRAVPDAVELGFEEGFIALFSS